MPRFVALDKPTAIIERTHEHYYVLQMGDRRIGSQTVEPLIVMARDAGYRATRIDLRQKELKVTHGL